MNADCTSLWQEDTSPQTRLFVLHFISVGSKRATIPLYAWYIGELQEAGCGWAFGPYFIE